MTGRLAPGDPVWLVLTTCPDLETGRAIARALVEERLAACGNVLPGVTSVYWWREAIESAAECLVLLKTRGDRLETLAERLKALHPYDVPELLALPVARGAPDYLRWVVEETKAAP
jgi:periplasmic divalent cation tolerance protein